MDFDTQAVTALDADVIKPRWYAFVDVLGDPLRATTGPVDVLFPPSTPDIDLAGQSFQAFHPDLVTVSEVRHARGGAGTVTASLSGLILNDNNLLNYIANPSNWQGRVARFWVGIHDRTGVQQGAVVPYYGGFMSSLEVRGDPGQQTIDLVVESFTASWSRASGRTYMNQTDFDPGDLSAEAALAAANGMNASTLTDSAAAGIGASASGGAALGNSSRNLNTLDRIADQ